MADQQEPKNGSRAARVPEQGRRGTVTFRCLPNLQARLRTASAASGRSVSEEIERRLETSFYDDDAMRVIRETIRQEMRAEFAARQGLGQELYRQATGITQVDYSRRYQTIGLLSTQPYNVAKANDFPNQNRAMPNVKD